LPIPIHQIQKKIVLIGQEGEKDDIQEKVKDTEEIDCAELADKVKDY
jgi:hypothetical protein